jgi:phage-related tail protein
LTIEELREIVQANSLAIAQNTAAFASAAASIASTNAALAATNEAVAGTNAAVAATNAAVATTEKSIAELTRLFTGTHESIKSLETVAETLLESVTKQAEEMAALRIEWQAYLRRLPKN